MSPQQSGPIASVCLVIPPSPFLLDERVFVSLGILKVAASLERANRTVNLLDLSGIENFLDPLHAYLSKCHDIAVGVTVTTPQLPAVARMIAVIRDVRPDLKIILGGPHVTLCYSALKHERKRGVIGRAHANVQQLERLADVLVAGDGELAIFVALLPDSPKFVDADNRRSGLFLSNRTFTDSALPARHLVDLGTYHYAIDGHAATSLVAQLGCPFGCGFCGGRHSETLRIIRTRSVESIAGEIEQLYLNYGYTGFMFYDDELNVNRAMLDLMKALVDLQLRLGVDLHLRGFIKAELLTAGQAAAMRDAGFRWLLCGFEAANPRILTNIDKRATLADNDRCLELARAYGIRIKALMSCGHPGETADTIHDIQDWLIRSEVDDFDCTIITTYPGTPYYDFSVPHDRLCDVWTYTHPKTGDRLHAYDVDYTRCANYYKGAPDGGYQAFVFTDHLSAEEIVRLRDSLEQEVRRKLRIAFNPSATALRYEHSMGQGLPRFIHGVNQAARETIS